MPQSNVSLTARSRPTSAAAHRAGFPILRLTAILPLAVLVALLVRSLPYTITPELVVVWLICLVTYVVANLLAGPVERGLWAGYINLAVMVAWLSAGLIPALALIFTGAGVTLLVRGIRNTQWRERPLARIVHCLNQSASRIAINGLALLAAAGVYQLLNGDMPLMRFQSDDFPPVILALLAGFVCTLVMGWLLAGLPSQPVWANGQALLQELLLLLLIAALPLILYSAGVAVFAIVMGLVNIQAARYQQIEDYRDTLARRVQELSLLNSIGQTTAANLVLDDVLLNIYRQVTRQISASVFYIALYDESRGMLDFRLVMADGVPVRWSPRRLSEGPVEHVIRHRQPLRVIADDRLHVRELGDLTQSARYLTFLGVPLLAGTKVLGIMTVLSDERAHTLGDNELNLLQTIASQAGLAVRNAMLYSQSTDLVQSLSYINDAAQRVLFNLDRDSALQAACETIRAITRSEKVAIFLLDTPRQSFRLAHCIGLTSAHEAYCQQNPYDPQPYLQHAVIVTNAPDDPQYAEAARVGQFQALIEIPLRSGSVVQGMMAVYYDYDQAHTLNAADIDLLETLAAQITAMLDNTEFFNVLQAHAQDMSQLVHLSRISTASMALDTLSHDIAAILRQITGMDEVMIALVDWPERRMNVLAAVADTDTDETNSETRLTLFPEVRKLAAEKRPLPRAFHSGDSGLSDPIIALMQQHSAATLALTPIITQDEVFGVVLMFSREPRYFVHREWQFMETAANQFAGQIRNVQLYERTQANLNQRLEQIAVIEDIAKQVSSSLDFSEIIQHVMEAAVKATNADLVSLALLTEVGDFYVIEQVYKPDSINRHYTRQASDAGVLGQVLHTSLPLLVPDNAAQPGYVSDFPGQFQSSLAVPLFREDAVIGVLNVESRSRDFFNESQAGFLQSLAEHAVISIENARFLEERQYEIDILTSLRVLALWLATADDRLSVAGAIMETAINLLQGQNAILFTYDSDADKLALLAHSWVQPRDENLGARRFAYRVVQEAARTGQWQIINDVAARCDDRAAVFDYGSAVAVPIQRAGHVQWVLYLMFSDQRMVQDRDLNTLELLAGQAAGHLENATLHERIRAGRDQMRAILDSTRDGMILLDPDMNLVETNRAAQELLGIDLEDYIGQFFPDVLLKYVEENRASGYEWDEILSMARMLKLKPQKASRRQFRHTVRGQTIYIDESGAPVMTGQHNSAGRLLVLRDITEEKELEIFRQGLIRLMVHDLRSPLVTVISGLRAVRPLVSPGMSDYEVSKTREVFGNVLENAEFLSRTVDSLMEIARLENQSLEIRPTPASLADLVKSALNGVRALVEQSQIRVSLDLEAGLALVLVDQDKVVRLLINLLDNALRYTPASGEVHVRAHLLPGTHLVQVTVADSGPGIPPQERLRIFEKFWRIRDRQPERGHSGTGLGLSLVKAVVEAHGGSIRVENDSSLPGACFVFTLPAAR